jgi:acetyltransferase-like isoleucine patch superfamily enzyme
VGRARLEQRIAALEATVQRLRTEQEADRQALSAPRIFGPHARLWVDPTAIVHDALFNTVSGTITVGEHAFFGHGVAVLTGTHDVERLGAERQTAIPDAGRDIVIGAGAWVSTRALVLGPCRIGEHAVVAAGAVVTGDVPAGAIVAGVPARVVGAVETLRPSSAR